MAKKRSLLAQIDRSVVPELSDRIIAATVLYLSVPLISRDKRIEKIWSAYRLVIAG